MILTRYSGPAKEPVDLDEAKDHLRVSTSDDNSKITGYITAARKFVEDQLGRALITQTWDFWEDEFPYGYRALKLPRAPLQSVTSITYIDSDGTEQTVSDSIYTVDADSDPGRVYLAYNQTWPTPRYQEKAIKIRYVAGYGDDPDDIPGPIIEAIKLQIQILYEQPINYEKAGLEDARDALLYGYRVSYL